MGVESTYRPSPAGGRGSSYGPLSKTAENTAAPAPATIPVETLVQSMKPEKPLIIEGAGSGFGAASGGYGGGGGSTEMQTVPQQ